MGKKERSNKEQRGQRRQNGQRGSEDRWWKSGTFIFLVLAFCAAVFLRFYGLWDSLFFGPEQGVDFLRMKEVVVDHHPLLVGAKTDIAGVFHGPIYYYLSTVPFILSGGSPVFIAFFLILINALTIFPLYKVTSGMFSKRAGVLAVILFAVSFMAISYTHWLSSHPLVLPLSALFIFGLHKFAKGERKYLFLVSLSYALLGQAEFLNYLFFGGILLVFIIFFFKDFKKQSILFLFANLGAFIAFGLLHYVIFDLKNRFIMTRSLLGLIHGNSGYYVSIPSVVSQVYEQLGQTLSGTILPFFPAAISYLVVVAAFGVLFKSGNSTAKKLLSIYILTPIFLMVLLRHAVLLQFFVYIIISLIILEAFLLDFIFRKNKVLGFIVFGLLLLIQLRIWYLYVPDNRYMFFASTQPDLHIKDERAVMDEIYAAENGKNFSFQSYTIPYWSQQAWEYLFWQYGQKKYGYLPVSQNGKTIYVIVQDDPSSLVYQEAWLKNTVPSWGNQKNSFRKGIFSVLVLDVPWVK
ncbi:MAG: ArnT family glycosyltransferase [Candidatus Levyibacteriota bacterium]